MMKNVIRKYWPSVPITMIIIAIIELVPITGHLTLYKAMLLAKCDLLATLALFTTIYFASAMILFSIAVIDGDNSIN